MKNKFVDLDEINIIINKVLGEINSSREQIFNILDNIRNEQEYLEHQIDDVKSSLIKVINEVDDLEMQDKAARTRLAKVSANFKIYTEDDIKKAYEESYDIRIKYFAKRNEEKSLRERRDSLEISLKKAMRNIEGTEKVINQISVAMSYLEGDALSTVDEEEKNSEMFLGIKILEAQENERKRIARDIHDGPAQYMANAIMRVDICKMVIMKDLKEGLKELSELKESVKIALKEVRSIIYDLRPMSLDDLGLTQTIEQVVNTIAQEANIDVKLKLKPVQKEIEPIIQVAVYRIVQEIFNNIKKHSKAKHAEVKLDYGTKYLILKISDDGIGFDVDETLKRVKAKGTSYGLVGMLDRVNQLQGKIKIESSIGEGTSYTINLPINREVIKNEKKDD
ncbi:MAG TPA: histidine kinase [Clostridiaceae bacterium]|nr:histidine kinase [Clostridiaceae bacterium]